MDERSLSDLLSQVIQNAAAKETAQNEAVPEAQEDMLMESVRTLSGTGNEGLEKAINEFMSGKGDLLETTQGALTRGSSATNEVADFLEKKFQLSPTIAGLIAALLLKMAPSLGKILGDKPAKKKPRKKTESKTSKKPKSESSSKKPKKATSKPKKATSKPKKATGKPKTTTKPATKKKSTSKTSKGTTKPKTAKRSDTVDL